MGVKSTVTLTRAEAERRFADLTVSQRAGRRRSRVAERIEAARPIGRPCVNGVDLHDFDEQTILEIYHHVDNRLREDEWRLSAKGRLLAMSDAELEDELEEINDEVAGGEGFENYTIAG